MLKKFCASLYLAFISFITFFTGRITWKCPPWITYLQQQQQRRPKEFWGIFFGIIVLAICSGYGYRWYQHLPRPLHTSARITAPPITPLAKTLKPNDLTVDFGIQRESFTPKSVAPLSLIGKEVTKGITLTPAIPGKWVWNNDSRLLFTPSQDWPAGQKYTLHFDKSVFAHGTKMESDTYTFSTQPFQATIGEFKFYQDPVNPKVRQAVATINFNYPVDPASFESETSLILEAPKNSVITSSQRFKLSINYDEHKRIAYLHTDTIPLPEVARYLELTIDKGVKSLSGQGKTIDAVKQTVLVPDAGSYFKLANASASIVRNSQDRPEQILSLETTLGVKEAELNKSLHVYLLPQDYPATATEEAKTNYDWQNPGEVTADILRLSSPVALDTIPADRDYATLHSYKINAATPRYMYVKIDKGVHGFGDFVLLNDYVAVIKVPEYPKEIGFLHKGSLLALSGEKKLSAVVRGIPAVKFQIARVLPGDVNQLVTQTAGNYSNPYFVNERFNQQNISVIFSEIQQFNATDKAKAQYTALDLGKYLSAQTNTGGPRGLFLLQATGWDVEKKIPLDVKTTRLVLITDLGLIVKDDSDGSHEVFVQSITQGTPVANVSVSILGKNGLPILTRTSDAQGHVIFPTLKDYTEEREPTVYIANQSGDVAFIPYHNEDRQLNYSRFDTGGIFNNNDEVQSLSAYVFSDRGIYRPGDTTHIGMIVKQAHVQPQPAGLPLEITVTDPRGTTIQDQKMLLDASGYLTFDFHTTATSPTGQYSINLFIVHDNHASSLLGSTTVRVAEFLPDRMRITSHLSKEQAKGWISPLDLTAKVGLWNLYGAAATNRKVNAKILLAPQKIQFKEFPKYTFIDPLFDPNKPPKVFSDTLPEAKTNEQGEAQFNLGLDRFDKATYELTFFAEGFEAEGGRSVTSQATALVSPLAYFVGYKADGDLTYIKQNDQRHIHFIAINPELVQEPVSNLKIQLTALHPVTTLVKKPDGTYQYQSLVQTSVVSTNPFTVKADGTDYLLPTQEIGDFSVSVIDQNNTELSRFKYSVVGASQLPLAKNAELSVKLNKTEYHPGEDIELQITAPYTGAGLITIERDKVYASQWFKTSTTSSVQKIHLPADFQGNGYVNVAFVRDWNSPDVFISPLSFSIVPFSVNHDNHAIKIDLTTPAVALPGEPFTINYKSDKPGKIIVFAVDEGILQVASYKTPDPLEFFFQKRALEVLTQQTVDLILPKYMRERELSAIGGDGGEEALKNNLNPFKRKTDLPVVYWSGIVDVDTTPRQVVYQIPDYFNGSLRVMAVAVAADAVGSADATAQVRGNFVINPNTPTVVAPGDEFEVTASVANNVKNSGEKAKVDVQLSVTPELELIGSATQSIVIPEGHEQTAHFKLRAKSQLGSAQFTFVASAENKISKMTSTVSVRPANSFMTSVISGSTTDANKSLTLDRKLYPEYRNVEAAISSSPLILVAGLQRYMDNFPYGCTEQLTSKAFPLLAMSKQPWFESNPRTITEKIETTIQMLGQRQMSSGGFSYWPTMGEYDSNTFASVYAMHFLTEAKEMGYAVPTELFRSGIGYLKELAAKDVTSLDDARIQAYAIYLLTRNEMVTTNYLTHLQAYLDKDTSQDWKKDITSAYMAASYALLKSDVTANKLIELYKPHTNSDSTTSDFYSTEIADAQYLYLVAKHFSDRLPTVSNKVLMPLVKAMNDDEINTILSSYTSLALNAYAQYNQASNTASLSVSEQFHDGKQRVLTATDSLYEKVSIDELATTVRLNNPGKINYFYQLTQSGFDKTPSNKELKQGIEVSREYRDLTGNVISKVALGSEIEVHIQVRALNDHSLNNIAIVDLLPGGFEIVNDSVKAGSMDYTDVREDRVVIFGSVNSDAKEIIYRIKATNLGQYTVPPIVAESMYDPSVKARNTSGSIQVIS